jgi:hypothetical protein
MIEGSNFAWHESESLPPHDMDDRLSVRTWLLVNHEGRRQITTNEDWVKQESQKGWSVEKEGTYSEILAHRATQKIYEGTFGLQPFVPSLYAIDNDPPPWSRGLHQFSFTDSDAILEDLTRTINKIKPVKPIPVGIVCTPHFLRALTQVEPSVSQSFTELGIEIHQRNSLTLPGEPGFDAPYRLFYDRQQLTEFLSCTGNP